MSTTPVVITALVALSAAGLVAWAWFAMAQVEQQLRSFIGFEDLDFEI